MNRFDTVRPLHGSRGVEGAAPLGILMDPQNDEKTMCQKGSNFDVRTIDCQMM